MAKVSFSALVEEIVGKLAGSVFQDSYGGYQVRTRVSPRNPQTYLQQLRRGEFAYITALWRSLTADQRQSFTDAAATPPEGFNLFVSANVNVSLIGAPLITDYVPSDAPAEFPLMIVELAPPIFRVMANSALQIVPDGTTLLLYATAEKEQSKIFTNPSQYQPISSYNEGFYFSDPVGISGDWMAHYGQFTTDKKICLKSVLINNSNGLRGPESIICAVESNPETFYIIDDSGNILSDNEGNRLVYQ